MSSASWGHQARSGLQKHTRGGKGGRFERVISIRDNLCRQEGLRGEERFRSVFPCLHSGGALRSRVPSLCAQALARAGAPRLRTTGARVPGSADVARCWRLVDMLQSPWGGTRRHPTLLFFACLVPLFYLRHTSEARASSEQFESLATGWYSTLRN